MKQFILSVCLSLFFGAVAAQNLQLHYDLGEGRSYLTSTVEMFRPDKNGYTFFFIDMDYGVGDAKGVSLSYWEIARSIKFWENPFAFHVEYNGGHGRWQEGDLSGAFGIEDAWLGGVEYSWDAEDFSRGFNLQLLYKNIRGKHDASVQITGVWYLNFLKDKLSFVGYADFWREDFVFGNEETKFVFQAEPQLWYNCSEHFAMGGEVEVDVNFLAKGLKMYPTIGAKVTF